MFFPEKLPWFILTTKKNNNIKVSYKQLNLKDWASLLIQTRLWQVSKKSLTENKFYLDAINLFLRISYFSYYKTTNPIPAVYRWGKAASVSRSRAKFSLNRPDLADSVIKSQCPSVCVFVCLSVCLRHRMQFISRPHIGPEITWSVPGLSLVNPPR